MNNPIPCKQLLKTLSPTNYGCRYNFVGNLSFPINLSKQKLKIKDGRLRKKRTFFHDELISAPVGAPLKLAMAFRFFLKLRYVGESAVTQSVT